MVRWRRLRWLVFLAALAIDGAVFYLADPFTPQSFMAAGVGAILIFIVAFEVSLLFKGGHRIKRALVGGEKVSFRAGRHMIALLRSIGESRLATIAVAAPVALALFSVAAIALVLTSVNDGALAVPSGDLAQYLCALFIPLLLAVPFIVENVSEWASYQYVIVYDSETHEPRLLVHYGVFSYDLKTLLIERTVTTNVIQTWWEGVLGYGDIVLRETGGGDGERLEALWRPRRFEREIRTAIKKARRGGRAPD